jgi:hypothetical protein
MAYSHHGKNMCAPVDTSQFERYELRIKIKSWIHIYMGMLSRVGTPRYRIGNNIIPGKSI